MKVAVVGTGLMGKGLTQIFAQCPEISQIFWYGRNKEHLNDGLVAIEKVWEKLISKGRISESDKAEFIKKIELSDKLNCVANCELIIEAVTECMEVKKSILSKISEIAGENSLLASNSSSLSITEIANSTNNPENVVGMHFFNPPALMKLVEIVVGINTTAKTISRAKEIATMLGKQPIEVKEAPGFIVNRMLIPMINEAVGALAEGIAAATDIDRAMTLGANHPLGPLALADLIGNDVILAIMETLRTETGDPKYRPHPLLRKMVRANHLGRKTRQGFYKY
jgi:3-hydroxybutyryl-CoA dehydrogenase